MIILGIDPGTATVGYGFIKAYKNGTYKMLDFGWIATDKKLCSGVRLKSIYSQLRYQIKSRRPDIVAIESLFFYNNAKTAMKVSEAIGVIKMAITDCKLESVEYSPPKIKSVVANNGRAKKEEMMKAVRKILKVRAPKKKKTHFNDVADALGIAICHARITQEGR